MPKRNPPVNKTEGFSLTSPLLPSFYEQRFLNARTYCYCICRLWPNQNINQTPGKLTVNRFTTGAAYFTVQPT